MNIYSTYSLKSSLRKALAKLFPTLLIMESYIRTEVAIANNKQFYNFDIYQNTGAINTEVRLDKNDSLFAYGLSFGLYTRDLTAQDQGKQPLQFYPNEQYFAAVAGPPAFVPSDLETAYNGHLSVKRGNNQIIENFRLARCRKVSDTQQSSASTKSSIDPEEAMVPLEWPLQLPGQEQLTVAGEFPVPSTIAWAHATANKENRMALVFDGFLVKGAKNVVSDALLAEAMGLNRKGQPAV